MARVYSYHVSPCLPARLQCLNDLSLNLRWSWDHPTIELFRRLDGDLWEDTGHNPRLILGWISQKRLAELESDEAFLAHMDRAWANLNSWARRGRPGGSYVHPHMENQAGRGLELFEFSHPIRVSISKRTEIRLRIDTNLVS